jgi:hypothetical protein
MYRLIFSCLLFAAFASSSFGIVTLSLQTGIVNSSVGNPVAAGTVGILVADNFGTGLPTSAELLGAILTAGGTIGDSKILSVFQAGDIDLVTSGNQMGFDVGGIVVDMQSGGLAQNTQLMLLWFPGITTVGATVTAGQQYGQYRSSTVGDGDAAFLLPADGELRNIAYLTQGLGGSVPDNTFVASFNVVPEPSVSILAMAGAMFAAFGRRRRRNRHP